MRTIATTEEIEESFNKLAEKHNYALCEDGIFLSYQNLNSSFGYTDLAEEVGMGDWDLEDLHDLGMFTSLCDAVLIGQCEDGTLYRQVEDY